jgi:hypothetical protein
MEPMPILPLQTCWSAQSATEEDAPSASDQLQIAWVFIWRDISARQASRAGSSNASTVQVLPAQAALRRSCNAKAAFEGRCMYASPQLPAQ